MTGISDNEQFVGKAIRESGVPRNEIFLTTKLWCVSIYSHPSIHTDLDVTNRSKDHGRVREAFEESLAKLDVEYIDLYLIHWPQAIREDGE